MCRQLEVSSHMYTSQTVLQICSLEQAAFARAQFRHKPVAAADECFCNCTLLYARETERLGACQKLSSIVAQDRSKLPH